MGKWVWVGRVVGRRRISRLGGQVVDLFLKELGHIVVRIKWRFSI